MRKMKLTFICVLLAVCTMLSAGCAGKTKDAKIVSAADMFDVRNNGTAIQWKYSEETEWHDLVYLDELKGIAGENGVDGADGKNGSAGKNGADGKNGIDGVNGTDGADGKDGESGADGRSVEIKKTDSHIQWRYEGGEWQNLVALSDITGPSGLNGNDGTNGADGKTPEFQTSGNILQWRYKGEYIWLNLYDLSLLKGADGTNGTNGINGTNGQNGADGKTPFIGENGNWWIGNTDTGVKAAGVNGEKGDRGDKGSDGKQIEVKKTDSHIQWRYEGGEWQNLVALSDITGPSGQNGNDGINGIDGTRGDDGKTPEFRVNGNILQWRYKGDEIWLDLYDLSLLKGADGTNGTNGTNGQNGTDGKTPFIGSNGNWWIGNADTGVKAAGQNGNDGMCAGYFSAGGQVYANSWNSALPFTVNKNSGSLITYNTSNNEITLLKGHSYSLVFNGTVTVSAKGDDKMCGVSLIDGQNNSNCMFATQTFINVPKKDLSCRLTVAYNTVYTATDNVTLKFAYNNMLLQDTNFGGSEYNITIIALD